MKLSSQNKQNQQLYLEPYTFSVLADDDVLIYNSLTGKVLEYRGSSAIAGLVRKLEDPHGGFIAEINSTDIREEIAAFVNDVRESFSGDIVTGSADSQPFVFRPKPVIKNYPPAKDFPSFSADDYLRNISIFLNEDNNSLCENYKFASSQVFCPAYNSGGYSEISFGILMDRISVFKGSTGIVLDLGGSDITRYSQIDEVFKSIPKLFLRTSFHVPVPFSDVKILLKLLHLKNSRTSLYVTFPDGPAHLEEILKHPEYRKRRKKVDINFLIQSMDEFQLISGFSQKNTEENIFYLPYFNGKNTDFFRENVFLAKDDILNLKPNQQQIYSRSLINEQLFGKMFIKTSGDAFANLNHEPVGNINQTGISDLVRNELYHGKSWNLTRLTVRPCDGCLYRLFCPPAGNYELFMNKFNFCDVL